MTVKIDTVIFDFGNVFVLWEPFKALEDKYTLEEWEQFKVQASLDELVEYWDEGASHAETTARIAEVDKRLGTDWVALYKHFTQNFAKSITYQMPGMPELVRELQALGIKTYGLTNWSREDFPAAKANVEGIGLMQGIVVSGEERIIKPNPAIYELILERYNIIPENAVFMDDRLDNVEAARKFGIHGLHLEPPFDNNAQNVREYLRGLGVAV